MRRRRFLGGALAGPALLFSRPAPCRARATADEASPWAVIAAALDRLLPEDGPGPGADTLGAPGYLRAALDGPRIPPGDREFVLQGARWLDDAARQEAGAPFVQLGPGRRDTVLTTIGRSEAGERWLSLLLDYLFEALLADPVYGANPGKVGWRWLEHRPGFPRPPAGRAYPHLAARWGR